MSPLVLPECMLRIDILGSWQKPHISSLACGVSVVIVEKAKWKLLKLPTPYQPSQDSTF